MVCLIPVVRDHKNTSKIEINSKKRDPGRISKNGSVQSISESSEFNLRASELEGT